MNINLLNFRVLATKIHFNAFISVCFQCFGIRSFSEINAVYLRQTGEQRADDTADDAKAVIQWGRIKSMLLTNCGFGLVLIRELSRSIKSDSDDPIS